MKLETINKFLNLFLVALVIQRGDEEPTRLYLRTVFTVGYVKNWPHIRLLSRLGL